MAMFKPGDLIAGINGSYYPIANAKMTLAVVTSIEEQTNRINITSIIRSGVIFIDNYYNLREDCFIFANPETKGYKKCRDLIDNYLFDIRGRQHNCSFTHPQSIHVFKQIFRRKRNGDFRIYKK